MRMEAKCPDCESRGTMDDSKEQFECRACGLKLSESEYMDRMRSRVDAQAPDYLAG